MKTQRDLGLILGGGGARAAYQVGVLRGIARRYPDFSPDILNGVSAGAINTAALANHTGRFVDKVESLTALWSQLTVDQVFKTNASSLLMKLLNVAFQATIFGGRSKKHSGSRGFVDTAPLRETLERTLTPDGQRLTGIETNIANGELSAVSLVGTRYATGRTVTWYQGRELVDWDRPMRRGVRSELTIDHVMASSALPLFFPAICVKGKYYGDGGIRQHAPVAPAIHLGARRLLSISTRFGKANEPDSSAAAENYPPAAQVIGVLMNAVFLDVLDYDVANLERINELLAALPEGERCGLNEIDVLSIRPSVNLGALAGDFEPELPGLFRFLTRRLGTKQVKSPDVLSMVMFQPNYLKRLIELGEGDADARADDIDRLLVAREAEAGEQAGRPA